MQYFPRFTSQFIWGGEIHCYFAHHTQGCIVVALCIAAEAVVRRTSTHSKCDLAGRQNKIVCKSHLISYIIFPSSDFYYTGVAYRCQSTITNSTIYILANKPKCAINSATPKKHKTKESCTNIMFMHKHILLNGGSWSRSEENIAHLIAYADVLSY